MAQKGKFSDNELGPVPDIFIKNERLEDVKVDEEELNDLDKLINSTKEKPAGMENQKATF